MVACQVYEPMLTPYTRYWPYMELFAPKTINILALLKRHNVTPAIYIYISLDRLEIEPNIRFYLNIQIFIAKQY